MESRKPRQVPAERLDSRAAAPAAGRAGYMVAGSGLGLEGEPHELGGSRMCLRSGRRITYSKYRSVFQGVFL